jgi:hypothetical protein
MLVRISTLLDTRAATGDDRLPVVDGLFDPRTGALRFLVLDVGSWFTEIDVLVAAREMGEIDLKGGLWNSALTRPDIDAAPRWSDPENEVLQLPLDALPPLVVGPFGATHAPLALHAEAAGNVRSGRRISKIRGLETVSQWRGMEAFGADGALGEIVDFVLDTETLVFSHVLLDRAAGAGAAALPYGMIRHRAEGQHHAVLDALTTDVAAAPGPETLDLAG